MSCRILIVDDEVNHRKALAIGLRIEGFTVLEAEDGRDALDVLGSEEVDMAIVDLMMPGINGLDLCRRMRFRHPTVPIVLTSAYHLSQRQLERAEIRVLGFLPKPFEMDELVAFLRAKLSPDVSADVAAG
ncbi:MAG: response regulator [Sandaracinaceae bacterium]|nr:response regulator [Sandaracinaceae bacterium]